MRNPTLTPAPRSERRGKRRNVKKAKPAPISERRAMIAKYGSYTAALSSTEYRALDNGPPPFASQGWMASTR
jgi:hypothetical protein